MSAVIDPHSAVEGAPVLKVKGAGVAFDGRDLRHRSLVGFVGRARVRSVNFPEDKGVIHREHVAEIESAREVDRDLIDDLLAEQDERDTGQLRLLAPEDEQRHAVRLILTERREHVEVGHLADLRAVSMVQILEHAETRVALVRQMIADAGAHQGDVESTLRAYIDCLASLGAVAAAGIEWSRQRLEEQAVERDLRAAEKAADDARQQRDAMAVSSDEDRDRAERRGQVDVDAIADMIRPAEPWAGYDRLEPERVIDLLDGSRNYELTRRVWEFERSRAGGTDWRDGSAITDWCERAIADGLVDTPAADTEGGSQ